MTNSIEQEPSSAGRLRAALSEENPLQIVGAVNAFSALLAERAGFRALYLSGAGVANASYGIPDLAMTTLENVIEDTRRISGASPLPILVDVDTGFDDPAATAQALENAGAAAIQIEDQVASKRCGHRPNKVLVPTKDMAQRLEQSIAGRKQDLMIMARTDAVAVDGLDAAIERARTYAKCGADLIFAEALQSLEDFKTFTGEVDVPVLANITEFGKTPLFSLDELREAGIRMVLYPLSAFRAMSAAALSTYREIRMKGSQQGVLAQMQTREELYDILDYESFERAIDETLRKGESK
jgi:methylisocitrate lyase